MGVRKKRAAARGEMGGEDEGGDEYVRFCPLRENVRRLSCHAEISGV